MSDKIKIFAACLMFLIVFGVFFMLLGGMIGYDKGKADCQTIIVHDTVTDVDTVTILNHKVDTVVRYVNHLVPIHDTVAIGDTTYLVLPYEHRMYSVEDTLEVWYSGIDPSIDSARIYLRSTVITNTIEQVDYRMPRLTAEVGAGALYNNNCINPYLMAEIRLNRPKTTFAAYGAIDQNSRWGAGINVTYRFNLVK